MMLLPRAPLGWWLLVGSVLLNLALVTDSVRLRYQDRDRVAKDQALLFALDRCTQRLERYAEVKALADAYDKMVEGRP